MKMKRMNGIAAVPRTVPPFEVVRNEERWLVWDGKDVFSLTLDELDQSFQRGNIGPATKVFTSGMSTWETLGALAHLDDAEREPAPVRASASVVRSPPEERPFPPLSLGVPAPGLAEWWNTTASAVQPITGVQRRPGGLRLAVRQLLVWLSGGRVRSARRRSHFASAGLWALGGTLSVLLFAALYRLIASVTEQATGGADHAHDVNAQPVASPASADPVDRSLAKVEPGERGLDVAMPLDEHQQIAALRPAQPQLTPLTPESEPPRPASRAKAGDAPARATRASAQAAQRAKNSLARRTHERASRRE